MRSIFSTIIVALFSCCAYAQVSVIPQPVDIKQPVKGTFRINSRTRLVVSTTGVQNSADFLNGYLEQFYGLTLVNRTTPAPGSVTLSLEKNAAVHPGSYALTIDNKGVIIKASDPEGVFYGVQSLIQLLPVPDTNKQKPATAASGLSVPFISINDYPRFAYRGMHLDVCRHFFPVSFVKKYIDYIALHKMNYFHWHLTDDQGWRIEIKKYPLLTKTGGYRNGTIIGHHPGTGSDHTPYGGYYTRDEIKDVIAYAAKRYITVIPEIELPGHASAAIAAYPQLSCFPDSATVIPGPASSAGNQHQLKKVQETWGVFEDVFCPSEYTFHFLEDVLDEVIDLFPSKYIHIGGDECPKDAWKKSAFCQDLMKKNGLKDEHELQSYFINRIEKHINSKGKNIIGWNEILEGGLAPNATVMSWQGEAGGITAANQLHHVIMTPGSHVYLDHSQTRKDDSLTIGGYTTVQKVYSYEPVPATLDKSKSKYILGAQANLWTEYISSEAKVGYQLFPRMSALSEVLWSPKENRNWSGFEPRLLLQMKRYHLWGTQYSRALFDPANSK